MLFFKSDKSYQTKIVGNRHNRKYKDPFTCTCSDRLNTSYVLLKCNENKQERKEHGQVLDKYRLALNIHNTQRTMAY